MIKIFSKLGSDDKVVIMCPNTAIGHVMETLNQKYGGSWVFVEQLKVNEMLKFNDGLVYNGFDSDQERYCNFIEDFTPASLQTKLKVCQSVPLAR